MSKHTPKSFKGQKLNSADLKIAINRTLKNQNGVTFSPAKLLKTLKISNSKPEVLSALNQLKKEGRVKETADEMFQGINNFVAKARSFIGTVDMTRTGAAYIIIDGKESDVYVGPRDLNGAMDGDTVEVLISPKVGRRRADGRVARVVKRGREIYMGKIFVNKKYNVVSPYKAPQGFEIFVFHEDLNGAEDGDIVTVRVTSWPTGKNRMIKGTITEVLGQENSSDMEMKSILIGQGFDLQFGKEAMAEADRIPSNISEQEIALRRDMRETMTLTIDPFNAKDFDDALSYKELENGQIEIGVHIADVSHYLKPDGPLDKEAFERSTSVYLVDRVLPMLPEKLSNELCSLRPHEDKLTFSAVYIFDSKFKIINEWYGKTITHSNRRFTYEEAQHILEGNEGDFAHELNKMNEIAKKLRDVRYANGAISFESDEVQFRLDEHGVPIELFVKERKEAHMLVEDFMLLANRTVAEYMKKKGTSGEIPFVYRVHDQPNEEKLNDFALYAAELGFKMDLSTPKSIANSFNDLAKRSEEDEALKLITPLAIRTMSKAIYTTDNIGHYGLAFENYTHFTSPIRRYSDVLSHRILYKNLGDAIFREDKAKLEIKCKHISAQERKAMDAERESIKYKQVEFMAKYVGEEFDGIVSGLHDKGIFVEIITTRCEGMVRFDQFTEPFILDETKHKAIGRRSGQIIKMGDKIRIKVLDADLDKRQLEFGLASEVE